MLFPALLCVCNPLKCRAFSVANYPDHDAFSWTIQSIYAIMRSPTIQNLWGGNTMRKRLLEILAVMIVVSVGATTVFAAGSKAGRNFVDVDGDGICDHASSIGNDLGIDHDGICDNFGVEYGRHYVDANGDGICDNAMTAQEYGHGDSIRGECGRNYVDANGDGICDNAMTGQGYGHGDSIRGECGSHYVDANGDGICDNYSTGQGRGVRNGFRGGRSR